MATDDGSWYNDGKGNNDDPLLGNYSNYDPELSNPASGKIGDYVVHGSTGGANHVGLFLAYNPQTEKLWSVEGNVSNSVQVMSRNMPPELADPAIEPDNRAYWTAIGRVTPPMFDLDPLPPIVLLP